MTWDEVFKIVGAAIASAGGAGAIIWYISKCLSDSMFKRYMESVKHTYDKDLEKIKHSYEIELTRVKSKFENITFFSNLQYEKEFNIYLEICEKMSEVSEKSFNLCIHIEINGIVELEEITNFKDSLREYQIIVNKYTPFIDVVLCTKLVQLGAYFDNQISETLDFIKNNEKNKNYKKYYEETNIKTHEINMCIKHYLDSLKTYN